VCVCVVVFGALVFVFMCVCMCMCVCVCFQPVSFQLSFLLKLIVLGLQSSLSSTGQCSIKCLIEINHFEPRELIELNRSVFDQVSY
jgi:hypothetical protein